MRATILMASILACAALTGCDQAPQAVAPVAPPPQASVLPPAPSPAASPAPVQTVTHHRHHWRETRYASESYSGSESETPYGYSSDSRSSTDTEVATETDTRRGGKLWIDGYGRAYHADVPARRAGTMTGKRLAAWGGYDVDCDH
jgi:hypothetical protein